MFHKLITFNTGNLRSLGDMTQLIPDLETYRRFRAEIASQKEGQRYLKVNVKNNASSGGSQTFKIFDTEDAFSSITNGSDIVITTDFPGGVSKLYARLKSIGALYFAGILYTVNDESVFGQLNLKSLRAAGVDKVERSVQVDLVDTGKYNQVNADPKQRIVAVGGELAYDTGLAGELAAGKEIEFLFQLINY